jgi:hypothetical protein
MLWRRLITDDQASAAGMMAEGRRKPARPSRAKLLALRDREMVDPVLSR